MTVEEYIHQLDSPLKEIAVDLRRIITSYSPMITEEIKWKVPTYAFQKKNICSIFAHKNHLNFQIFFGSQIADAQELGGTGKTMRHLKISSINDIDETKIQKYLSQIIMLLNTQK